MKSFLDNHNDKLLTVLNAKKEYPKTGKKEQVLNFVKTYGLYVSVISWKVN